MDITLPDANLDDVLDHPLVDALLKAASDGVIVIDAESRRVRRMNPRARDLLGYSADDAVGHLCRDSLNSPSCLLECPLNEILSGRPENAALDLFYRGADGDQVLHARTRMIVVRGPDGAPLVGIELFEDLSEHHAMRRALSQRRSLAGIIGRAPNMVALYELVEQVAPYELPVLVTGESGTGRERFADAVVELSPRKSAPYLKVNCAALHPSLLESELFGHRAGAAPGASTDRQGAIERANGGTILLDEVGALPLSLQARLLRVLQDGQVQRLGDPAPRPVDVRVIAIGGADVADRVDTGQLREDLFYRLAGVQLAVPPLRERRNDIPDLADHFLLSFAREAEARGRPKPVRGLTDDALKQLMHREWRGNVRELQNVLRLAWIRAPEGGRITPEHLVQPGTGGGGRRPAPINLAELETQAIRRAMDRSDGNMAAAARLLGIDRSTLWRKLKKTGDG